jgi:uncharacterized small protein (DUF1192 family)
MSKTMTLRQLADRLDRLAEADKANPGGGDSELLSWAARGLRQAEQAHAAEFRRAEAALRRVSELQTRIATLQAELTEERANVRALEAVAARPAPIATEQHVEVDSRGSVRRVTTRPLDDRRPVGFS